METQQDNRLSMYIVYGGAVLTFFAVTAFLLLNINTSLNPNYNNLRNLDELLSSSADTTVNIADQYFPLVMTNTLLNYEQFGTDQYRVNYRYTISNNYDFDIQLNNAVSYFLQQDTLARINKVTQFSSKDFKINEYFNGVTINKLFTDDTLLSAGKTFTIEMQLDFTYLTGDAPIRNIVEFTGTKLDITDVDVNDEITSTSTSTARSTSSSTSAVTFSTRSVASELLPDSYPDAKLFSGSAVSLFYPGIEIDVEQTLN